MNKGELEIAEGKIAHTNQDRYSRALHKIRKMMAGNPDIFMHVARNRQGSYITQIFTRFGKKTILAETVHPNPEVGFNLAKKRVIHAIKKRKGHFRLWNKGERNALASRYSEEQMMKKGA